MSGDPQKVIDSLTPKMRAFVEAFHKNPVAKDAAIAAGYATNNPAAMGCELMKKPAIRMAIDALRVQRADFSSVTKDYVLKKIMKTIERAEEDGNHQAVLRGTELLAKHLGMFIERTEISGPDGEAIKMEKVQEDVADFTRAIAGLASRK